MSKNWSWSNLCSATDFADSAARSAALLQLHKDWQNGAAVAGVTVSGKAPVQTIAPLWLDANGAYVEHNGGGDPVAYKLTLSGPERN